MGTLLKYTVMKNCSFNFTEVLKLVDKKVIAMIIVPSFGKTQP